MNTTRLPFSALHSLILTPGWSIMTDNDGAPSWHWIVHNDYKQIQRQDFKPNTNKCCQNQTPPGNNDTCDNTQIGVTVTTREKKKMTRTKTAQADKRTMPLPGVPKKPGRPYTGNAMTNAQRQAQHRVKLARERAAEIDNIQGAHSSTSDKELQQLIATAGPVLLRSLWIEMGRRKGWLK